MTQKSKVSLGDLEAALLLKAPLSEKNRSLVVERLSEAAYAEAGDLVFLAQESFSQALEKRLQQSSQFAPLVVVSSEKIKTPASLPASTLLLFSREPMLAFARASRFFSTESRPAPGIHPSAVIHPTAEIADNVSIGPFCVVEEKAQIGKGSILYGRVSIGARAKVGCDGVLFPGVVLYQDTNLGDRVRVHANSVIGSDGFGYAQEISPENGKLKHIKIEHQGCVRIGHDVEIGASTTIDRGTLKDTVIENGCIIDNQVQIGHNCHLEESVIVCGSTGLAGSVHVGKFAVLAGFVGVANGSDIGTGAQIAGYTMVFGKVPAGVKWGGVPGRPLKEFMRLQAMMGRLPDIYEDWKKRKEG